MLAGIQPVAPYLMPIEVANVLYRRALRGDISVVAATTLLDGLLTSILPLKSLLAISNSLMKASPMR